LRGLIPKPVALSAPSSAPVIEARDQRTTSGTTGVMTRINRPKT
jgi:hypothetical protein